MLTARITLSASLAAALLSAAAACTSTTVPAPPDAALVEAIEIGDADAVLNLADEEITWTDAEGRTLGRSELARMIPTPAIEEEGGAQVRRLEYGRVAVVRIDRGMLHALRVWVRRPAGWRLLVYQEVRSLAAPPATTPGNTSPTSSCS